MPPRTDPSSSQSPLLDEDETAKAYSSIADFHDDDHVASSADQTPTSTGWTTSQQKMNRIGKRWKKFFLPLMFVFTLCLPIAIYRSNYLSFLAHSWFAPLMGIVACAIPSGGAPVAGGVVFLPVLSMAGLEPHDAVGFAVTTQMFGIGIFAPLGWMARDPTVLMFNFLQVTFPYALAGLLTGLLLIPLGKSDEVLWAFTIFISFLAWYTVHGLVYDKLDVSGASGEPSCCPGEHHNNHRTNEVDSDNDIEMHVPKSQTENILPGEIDGLSVQNTNPNSKAKRRKIRFSAKEYAIYAVTCYFGGILTAWIGIGVEKLTFVLLTYFHNVDVTAAGVSSIFLTGFLSAVAFLFHSLCAPADNGPGPHFQCAIKSAADPTGNVLGNIPYEIVLAVLPGILIGSVVGPAINAAIGPRNMMVIFVCFLLFDIGYNLVDLL